MADFTLSRASLTAVSGNPTIENAGREFITSVSTQILYAFKPIPVAV